MLKSFISRNDPETPTLDPERDFIDRSKVLVFRVTEIGHLCRLYCIFHIRFYTRALKYYSYVIGPYSYNNGCLHFSIYHFPYLH